MFNPNYNRPWKQHEKRKWLEHALKDLHKKLSTTVEEINKADANGVKKLKAGKDSRKKIKFCSFPVSGRKKSKIKHPLVNVIHAEPSCQKEAETSNNATKKKLPEAEKFWKYVDVCYELTLKACNVKDSKEAVQKEEAKKCLKLPRKKKKRVKKKIPAKHRCFARTRPGFLTSVVTDTNFFYPIIIGKRIMNIGVKRCSARISKPSTQMDNEIPKPEEEEEKEEEEEEAKLKLKQKPKLQPKPQRRSAHICNANAKKTCLENVKPKSQQCKASKPKKKKRKRKNFVSKAKSESRCKRKR